jgi:hypothetical protein
MCGAAGCGHPANAGCSSCSRRSPCRPSHTQCMQPAGPAATAAKPAPAAGSLVPVSMLLLVCCCCQVLVQGEERGAQQAAGRPSHLNTRPPPCALPPATPPLNESQTTPWSAPQVLQSTPCPPTYTQHKLGAVPRNTPTSAADRNTRCCLGAAGMCSAADATLTHTPAPQSCQPTTLHLGTHLEHVSSILVLLLNLSTY